MGKIKWDDPIPKTINFQLEFSQTNNEKRVVLWIISDGEKINPSDILSGGLLTIISKTLQSLQALWRS